MEKTKITELLNALGEQFKEAINLVDQQKSMIHNLQEKTKGLNSTLTGKEAEINELVAKINKFKKAFQEAM